MNRDSDYYKHSVFYYIGKGMKKKSSKESALLCFVGAFCLIFAYAPIVFSNGYCTDLEYMFSGNGMYNWSEIGRFNLILLKYITSFGKYRPIWEGILFCVTLCLLFAFLFLFFTNFNPKDSTASSAFAAILTLIFPTFVEQFYFRFQSFEVAFALLLLVVSNIFLTDFIKTRKMPLPILAVLLTALSFGTYQSMMNVAVTFYFGMFIILLQNSDKKTIKFGALSCTLHFVSSLLLYKILTLIFCQKGSYFGSKVMWKELSFSTCCHSVIHYIKVVLLGEKYVYTLSFLICFLLALSAVVIIFLKEKGKALLTFAGIAGLCASPFIMAVIQGFEAEARTQLALPFATGFLWYFFSMIIFDKIKTKKKSTKWISLSLIWIISVFVFCLNSFKTEKLLNSGLEVKNQDIAYSSQLINDLSSFNCQADDENSKPVIFIGLPDIDYKESSYKRNDENNLYLLTSVYSLDYNVEPKYFFSTNRILGFYSFLGADFNRPSVSTYMDEAHGLSSGMPSYPANGSIVESENCIVVKLSDY